MISIAVLCGGPSSEREVSLASGRNIAKALDKNRYAACVIEVPKDRGEILKLFAAPKTFANIDIALIALHGTFGEDGVVQNLLDLRSIPHTGSGAAASALGMDKVITMTVARVSGLRVPEFFTVQKHSNILENVGTEQIRLSVRRETERLWLFGRCRHRPPGPRPRKSVAERVC